MKLILLVLSLALLVFAFTWQPKGCRREPASGLRTVQMQIGSRSYTLEVADTPPTREFGLMNRDSMPADRGMIFVFPDERRLSFWMKNTRIPLDILFLDGGGQVVSIHQMKPHDLSGTPSEKPAKYAIELNKGEAARAGVNVGDRLVIPRGAVNPPGE